MACPQLSTLTTDLALRRERGTRIRENAKGVLVSLWARHGWPSRGTVLAEHAKRVLAEHTGGRRDHRANTQQKQHGRRRSCWSAANPVIQGLPGALGGPRCARREPHCVLSFTSGLATGGRAEARCWQSTRRGFSPSTPGAAGITEQTHNKATWPSSLVLECGQSSDSGFAPVHSAALGVLGENPTAPSRLPLGLGTGGRARAHDLWNIRGGSQRVPSRASPGRDAVASAG